MDCFVGTNVPPHNDVVFLTRRPGVSESPDNTFLGSPVLRACSMLMFYLLLSSGDSALLFVTSECEKEQKEKPACQGKPESEFLGFKRRL